MNKILINVKIVVLIVINVNKSMTSVKCVSIIKNYLMEYVNVNLDTLSKTKLVSNVKNLATAVQIILKIASHASTTYPLQKIIYVVVRKVLF